MSHFILQENSDGTVNLTKKKQVLAEVCGKVEYINQKNRKLFRIHAEKMNRKFRCVLCYDNPFFPVREGDAIFAIAEYVVDPQYGDTLNIIQPPFVVLGEDKNTVIKSFVAALKGTGFGTMKAHKLLDEIIIKTGSLTNAISTLDRMASYYCYKKESDIGLIQPYTLILKEKQMLKLLEWWYKNRNLRRLYLLGINNREIRSSKKSPEEMYQLCLDNPYKIFSLDINKCDDIAGRLGKEFDATDRKCAEICRKLDECMESRGWTGVPTNILIKMFPDISNYVEKLRKDYEILTELHTAYLPYPHEVETGLTDIIHDMLDGPSLPHALHSSEISYTRTDLSDNQKLVIQKALSDNICVIKGVAGGGKTTIIKELIHNLEANNIKYRVVSFTGKAVARIREVTEKKEPMTMHMSITMGSGKGKKVSEFSHLIIDEASMVTSDLMYDFIGRFGSYYRITLVGDPNQLMPIGWGTFFDQVIKSRVVPTYTLNRCYRVSGEGSGILLNANNIVECNEPDYNGPPFDFDEAEDFNIIDGNVDTIKELITILRDNGIDGSKITIISPYNKYLTDINKICQDIYNGTNRFAHDSSGRGWRINDRVMMTQNNYKINVMNGDEGTITDITPTQLQVTFKDGKSYPFLLDMSDVENDENDGSSKVLTVNQIAHSFGVSVHRYQGSECDYVIFYIPQAKESKFLNKNLLYTGITRAKKMIWMVGDYETMVKAATTAPAYRCDNLSLRLKNRTISLN